MHGLHSFRSCRLHVLAETAFSARCVEALLPRLHEASVTLYLFRLEIVFFNFVLLLFLEPARACALSRFRGRNLDSILHYSDFRSVWRVFAFSI